MRNAEWEMISHPTPGPSHVQISSLIQHLVGRGDRCGVPSFLQICNLYEVNSNNQNFPPPFGGGPGWGPNPRLGEGQGGGRYPVWGRARVEA